VDKSNKQISSLKYVRAQRISTEDKSKLPAEEKVCVAQESPLAIDVEGVETYTVLCTPMDELALAAGFLFGEGVIRTSDDFEVLKLCDDDSHTVRVRLKDKVPRIADSGRNLLIVSSCGACGSENLQKRIDSLPAVGKSFKIKAGRMRIVYNDLQDRQTLFQQSGGTHGAALFDKEGSIISSAEDTGRHNALDKATGKCLLAGTATAGLGVVLTSRLSLEMVSRCARAGIELVAAVSAPTSLAIDVADKCNITLCAFVRDTRATVFTHPGRIIDVQK
jgi:FdhD protein